MRSKDITYFYPGSEACTSRSQQYPQAETLNPEEKVLVISMAILSTFSSLIEMSVSFMIAIVIPQLTMSSIFLHVKWLAHKFAAHWERIYFVACPFQRDFI